MKMMKDENITETFESFDAGDHVRDELDARALLEVALEESAEDPSALPAALGIIARSGNMSELATTVGMSRDGLYTALSANGNPTWSTITKVTEALGLRIEVTTRTSTAGKSTFRKNSSTPRRLRQHQTSHTPRSVT
jgi:probable addiction module antidote protein